MGTAYLLGVPCDPINPEPTVSLLFKADFLGHPIHVLEIRGRVAFFLPEIGAAAGHLFGGERFVMQVTREWAGALEDDHDVAILTRREFERAKRETGLPLSTRESLVLFAPGVRKALAKSNARHASLLQGFLDEEVYPRIVPQEAACCPELVADAGEQAMSEASPPSPDPECAAFARRCTEYLALRRYAGLLMVHRNDVNGYLSIERLAVEALLGHGLWNDPAAAAAQVA